MPGRREMTLLLPLLIPVLFYGLRVVCFIHVIGFYANDTKAAIITQQPDEKPLSTAFSSTCGGLIFLCPGVTYPAVCFVGVSSAGGF